MGIDSDPGRFSSLEHSAVEHKEARSYSDWNTMKSNKSKFVGSKTLNLLLLIFLASPKAESVLHQDGLSPDVLNSSNCANCPRWQNKYIKAKQTLAATLEKLQAANMRKDKVDRALSKELGKTHNILCQVNLVLR